MGDYRRDQLRVLEEDYLGQPPVVQQTDLQEINRLRAELGMPLVDAQLKELTPESMKAASVAPPREAPRRDHTEARRVYEAYLAKMDELKVHQAYANRVVEATAGAGQTPVRPLATMGTGGGPLLCDHCGKAIVLEGGACHGLTADVAWERHGPRQNWTSYILGGLVVEVKSNGTLRIYHGYPGNDSRQCCNVALREEQKARANATPKECPVRFEAMLAFLEDELPETTRDERQALFHKIIDAMFSSFDPGLGINRP